MSDNVQIKNGDTVRVINDSSCGGFPVGTIGTVSDVTKYDCTVNVDGDGFYYHMLDDLEPLS